MTDALSPIVVATFYQFVPLPDCAVLRDELAILCDRHHLHGTILLAQEGINGTVAGSRVGVDDLVMRLRSDVRFASLEVKESFTAQMPFQRMKVRLRPEIITLGQPTANPLQSTGTHVAPTDWNALITDPSVTVLDVRNQYEVECGTFDRAINPRIDSFREFPDYVQAHLHPQVHHKVAMFCTGGIRCEKASAYLLAQGFEEVYQLQGGILKYLQAVPVEDSLWQGDCFVFDDRLRLDHRLRPRTFPSAECYQPSEDHFPM